MIVQIKLKTSNIYEITERINELTEIRIWLDDLVGHDSSLYNMKIHSMSNTLRVWFEHDEHATLFSLRWI